MSKGRANPFKVRLTWGAVALGLVFGAVYVARQEWEPSRSIQSDVSSPSTKKPKTRAPADNRAKTDADTDEQDADFLASATPALSDPHYHSDPLHDEEVVPHPITKERIRMAEQHALFEHITKSLKLKDFRLASRLIKQHEMQYGDEEGWKADRHGFERILDCLETRSEHARTQAEDFIDEERLSPLRRHVRRVCLDGDDF